MIRQTKGFRGTNHFQTNPDVFHSSVPYFIHLHPDDHLWWPASRQHLGWLNLSMARRATLTVDDCGTVDVPNTNTWYTHILIHYIYILYIYMYTVYCQVSESRLAYIVKQTELVDEAECFNTLTRSWSFNQTPVRPSVSKDLHRERKLSQVIYIMTWSYCK